MLISSFFVISAITAFANAASLTNTAGDFGSIKAGQPFKITWAGASGPVTLLLKSGPSTNLKTVSTIASGQTGNSYTWTPDASLPTDHYAIEIQDASGPNYSVQFPISKAVAHEPMSSSTAHETYSTPAGTGAYSYPTGYSSSYTSRNMTTPTGTGYYTPTSYVSYTPTATPNATESSSTLSSTTPHTHTSATPTPSDTNNAADITSPIAFVLLAFASFFFLQ